MNKYEAFDYSNPNVRKFYNTLCQKVYNKSLDQFVAEAKGEA